MYQVFPTAIREDGTVDEQSSFQQHISKAGIKYRMINKEAGSDTIKLYTNTLHDFYESLGFTGENQKGPITGLPVEEYPILSDVITYFEQRKEQEREPDYKTLYSSILLSSTQLRKQYGNMFNGPTTFKDLGDVQVVCYNTNTLLQLSEDIQDLQMYVYVAQNGKVHSTKLADQYSLKVVAPSLGNTTGQRYKYNDPIAVLYNGGWLYLNGGNFFYCDKVKQYITTKQEEGTGGSISSLDGLLGQTINGGQCYGRATRFLISV